MTATRVNVVSESAFTRDGHGVHTAYLEDLALLRERPQLEVVANDWRTADVVHAHTVGPFAVGHLLRAGGRSVVTAHLTQGSVRGSLAGDRYWGGAFMKYAVQIYNLAGRVLAVSEYAAAELAEVGVRRPIVTVPNAIDVRALRAASAPKDVARRRLGIAADAFVVVCVGQVQPRKGVEAFLQCADVVRDAQFYWVGDLLFGAASASRHRMTELMTEERSNVHFAGQVRRTAVLDYLSAADVFFLPSHHENCPMAVLEAMALGVPVVLRELANFRQLFADDCRYGSEESFPALIRALMADTQLCEELGARAAAAAWRFDARVKADRLQEIYTGLV